MHQTVADQLTARFYEWEQRGRGHHTFLAPIELEPEFHPFFGHILPEQQPVRDNKRHSVASWIIHQLTAKPEPQRDPNRDLLARIPPVRALPDENADLPVTYCIVFPEGEKLRVDDIEPLLLMLSYTEAAVSFEIVATHTAICIQIACRPMDEHQVYAQVRAYFPAAIISKDEKGVELLLPDTNTTIMDFGLAEEFMRPICYADDLPQDSFVGLFAAMEHLGLGESGVVQVLFKGTKNPWAESIMRAVSDNQGGSFFGDDPEMLKLAKEKVSAPLFAVAIRVAGQSNTAGRPWEIAKAIGSSLLRLTESKSNRLMILSEDGYPIDEKIDDVYFRQSHRIGMLLNSHELATIVHFPTAAVSSLKLERDARKTKEAPAGTTGHKFALGLNVHHGKEQVVTIPSGLRLRHTHIIGATGTGKSTLLLSMMAQDMRLGNGFAALDPHGDLIESILPYVPDDRIQDVIIIDPADGDYPVAFNILSAHSEVEKDILSSDLVAAFKRLSTSWGDQMNSVFANAILAFLESPDGGTLVDLRRFLIEKPFRDAYLKKVPDQHIVYYWQHEYPLLKSSSIGSILTRLDTFLRPKLIRNMVAQKKGLDFEHILDSKKILLVKLSQGLIGAENSFLLGTFFVSKMYQAAMARQAKTKETRSDYYLYIDEFHHFATPSMSHILSGARKYGLGLILAHQDMQQVQKHDAELASSVTVNAATRICFRLGDVDAKRFASGFSSFEAEDLENLKTGEAIARIEQPNHDFTLSTIPLEEIDRNTAVATAKIVIERSRHTYGTRKELVEQELSHIPSIPKPKENMQQEVIATPVQEKPLPVSPATPIKPAMPKKAIPEEAPSPKDDTRHRYLQMLIKRMAESRGYIAKVEELTPDWRGRVDVALEKDGKKIACEVSVTTDEIWELHNVEKCLAAGYDEVIVCSENAKALVKIRKLIEARFDVKQPKNVHTLTPDDIILFFDKQTSTPKNTEQVIKGYRVTVGYNDMTTEEITKKQERVIKTVAKSITKGKR